MPLRAIVIGAGIGGLTASLALRRAGIEVEVYERAAVLTEVGAGIGLWANALRALDRIDVGAPVRRLGVSLREAVVRTWRGDVLMRIDNADLERRFGDVTLVVHRAELLDTLLVALGSDAVRLGRTCAGFEQGPDGVQARFADGGTASADLLVGADGLHSRIRAALHGESRPSYAGYTVWRATVGFDHARITAGETWGPRGRFGIFPVRGDRVYWYASVNAPEGERAADGERRLLGRVFDGYHDPIPALIEASAEESILRNDAYDRPPLARWGEGRVTLLGDAAHPMTPNLGQGACQAIEDAIVLAERLRDAGDVPAALRGYERRRLERTRRIVERSRALGRVAQIENRALATLRDVVMPIAGPLQKMEVERILGAEL